MPRERLSVLSRKLLGWRFEFEVPDTRERISTVGCLEHQAGSIIWPVTTDGRDGQIFLINRTDGTQISSGRYLDFCCRDVLLLQGAAGTDTRFSMVYAGTDGREPVLAVGLFDETPRRIALPIDFRVPNLRRALDVRLRITTEGGPKIILLAYPFVKVDHYRGDQRVKIWQDPPFLRAAEQIVYPASAVAAIDVTPLLPEGTWDGEFSTESPGVTEEFSRAHI